ncbi:MAG TPA: aminopeptidase [Longimicrobiaceae bacterium]
MKSEARTAGSGGPFATAGTPFRRALWRYSTALLLVGLCTFAGCSPFYVLRAGYEEAKILSRRQSIAKLVRDTTTPPETREKLRLVLAARQFAVDSLGLDAGDSYTTFSRLDSDTLALIISAAYRDRFEPYTWWFPIVGHVPYKGYFSERKAREAIRNLERKGLDTYLRPTSAFSTLGWFNDPLVSPLLRYDSVTLAGTVIHELTHNTMYVPGQAAFNESLAEFVGSRGAVAFFCARMGTEAPECTEARAAWRDQLVYGEFLDRLVTELDSLYNRSDIGTPEKLARREEIFERAREKFRTEVRPRLTLLSYESFLRIPLNNATLLSRRLYYHRLDLFEELYRRMGGDLRRTLEVILASARERRDDPYAAVERLIRSMDPPASDSADSSASDGTDPYATGGADSPASDNSDGLAGDSSDPPANEGGDP